MRLLSDIMPRMNSDPLRHRPNLRVLCFTLAVCALATLLFGLAPALRAIRPDLSSTLKDQAGAVAGGGQAGWRKMLVTAQSSLAPASHQRRVVRAQPLQPEGCQSRI